MWLTCVPHGRDEEGARATVTPCRLRETYVQARAYAYVYAWGSRWRRTRHMPARFHNLPPPATPSKPRSIQPCLAYEPLFSRRGKHSGRILREGGIKQGTSSL